MLIGQAEFNAIAKWNKFWERVGRLGPGNSGKLLLLISARKTKVLFIQSFIGNRIEPDVNTKHDIPIYYV